MSDWPASWRIILLFVFCCLISGCVPIAQTPVDEEKDPNFIDGRNHLNMMDYKGAVESFERAVQANPRNAAAHFELGVLYQDRMQDPLAAAYHYQKHLTLRPKSEYAEAVKPRLVACKIDVAKTFNPIVINDQVHRDLTKLTNELGQARQYIDSLRAQLAAKPTVVTQWVKFIVTNTVPVYIQPTNTYQQPRLVATNAIAPRMPPTNAAQRAAAPVNTTVTPRPMEQRAAANVPQVRTAPAARPRAHLVRSGDTMASVARRYGISLQRLQAANPSIQPRKMQAGQTLNIPSQ